MCWEPPVPTQCTCTEECTLVHGVKTPEYSFSQLLLFNRKDKIVLENPEPRIPHLSHMHTKQIKRFLSCHHTIISSCRLYKKVTQTHMVSHSCLSKINCHFKEIVRIQNGLHPSRIKTTRYDISDSLVGLLHWQTVVLDSNENRL